MDCLNNVIYGCTLATYGASQRCRKSRASESCTRFVAAIRLSARCRRQDGSGLLRLTASGLSISPASRPIKTRCSGRGREYRIHGKAFRSVGRTSACIRLRQRLFAQRRCKPGTGGFSSAEEEAWVNGHQVGATPFSWNIGLIVCYRQSWNKSMNCWCPISDGPCTQQRLRRN
jgi:hypothetical protein